MFGMSVKDESVLMMGSFDMIVSFVVAGLLRMNLYRKAQKGWTTLFPEKFT